MNFFKKISVFFIFFFSLGIITFALDFKKVDIECRLNKDNSAQIIENWQMSADSGTEMYVVKNMINGAQITDLQVFENGREFENVGAWDTSKSLAQKSDKSGVLKTSKGYELCWGLGTYGDHNFKIVYNIKDMVQGAKDYNFLSYVFVEMPENTVGSADVTIFAPSGVVLTKNNVAFWNDGGAVCDISLTKGKIVATSVGAIEMHEKLGILVRFPLDMFMTNIKYSNTFDEVKSRELLGLTAAKKSQNKTSAKGFFDGIGVVFWIIMILLSVFGSASAASKGGKFSIKNDKFLKEYKKPDYSREIPFKGSLAASFLRFKKFGKVNSEYNYTIFGVYILKWVQGKFVTISKREVNKLFGKKEEDILTFSQNPMMGDTIELSLYNIFLSATDNDGALTTEDFKKWSQKNYNQIKNWFDKFEKKGLDDLINFGAVEKRKYKFLGFIPSDRNEITELGVEMTKKMFGFKKYLEDFTIINERAAREVELWDEYLIFAQLFGIAEKVAEQFKDLYPKYFEKTMGGNYSVADAYLNFILINSLMRNYSHAAYRGFTASTQFIAGQGGRFGGNFGSFSGGFSGGGGGGGVR